MYEKLIIGAIAGDIIGSVHKGGNRVPDPRQFFTDKSRFTCNSVLTVAVMDALLNGREYTGTFKMYEKKYPGRGYGNSFVRWVRQDNPKPYNSWNNGAAIRVSPVAFTGRTVREVLDEARKCAEVSHNHPDGIKGAQATAASVFLAKNGRTKEEIRSYIESTFAYDLQRKIEDISPGYFYDSSCQGSVPEAIIAFLDSTDYESAIRLSVSLGGECGTLASITGAIAQAFYKEIPLHIAKPVINLLTPEMYDTVEKFSSTYSLSLFH